MKEKVIKPKIKIKSSWMRGFTLAKPSSDIDKVESERKYHMPRLNRKGSMNK